MPISLLLDAHHHFVLFISITCTNATDTNAMQCQLSPLMTNTCKWQLGWVLNSSLIFKFLGNYHWLASMMLLQLTLTLQIGSTKELPTLSLLALRHVWGSLKMKTPLLIQLLTWMKPSLSSNSRNKTLDEHIDCVLSLSLSAHVGFLINHICHKTSAPTPPPPAQDPSL